jgi:hypothetical protein
MSVDILGNG